MYFISNKEIIEGGIGHGVSEKSRGHLLTYILLEFMHDKIVHSLL